MPQCKRSQRCVTCGCSAAVVQPGKNLQRTEIGGTEEISDPHVDLLALDEAMCKL
jgi:hypothetical protein